jgi:hypothetical protein
MSLLSSLRFDTVLASAGMNLLLGRHLAGDLDRLHAAGQALSGTSRDLKRELENFLAPVRV